MGVYEEIVPMGVDPAVLSYRLAGASFSQLSVMQMLFGLFFGIILIIVLPELLHRSECL